jgi:uncharacterized flavoprotein (TIGR03862 family)
VNLAIVGAGPAGLKAAETAAQGGASVTIFEGKPSAGRKFLVAGHGGLNLTHSEDLEPFAKRYRGGCTEVFWKSLLREFGNQELKSWADGLGIETFIGTSGRVFPKEFKAAPLLRRWIERLRSQGVNFKTRYYLKDITPTDGRFLLSFHHQNDYFEDSFDQIILALGGASWPETGSDAQWIPILERLGVKIAPFRPANCGWEVNWNTDILNFAEGHPLKNIEVTAGSKTIAGELLITRYGLEGGSLYQLGSMLREMEFPVLKLDLKPSFSAQELAEKIQYGNIKGKVDLLLRAIKAWRLSKAAGVLLGSLATPLARNTPLALAEFAKSVAIHLTGPRPIAEAISSAGGVCFSELNEDLMVKSFPGLFVAGEMIDWEAPTGGYLLQGAFSTGTRAARGALKNLQLPGQPTL